tara:strand:- start:230378 stop:231379 length:1002 start_codon:yes stop_codon:yes gene_type:complete
MRFVHIAVTFVTLIILCLGAAGLYAVHYVGKPSPLSADKLVEVPAGWGMNRLAYYLEQEGVIESALPFRFLARINGQSGDLRSGEFLIKAQSSLLEILAEFTEGISHQRQVTFPEGATSYEIVRILNENENFTGAAVVEIPVEGSLLPETYNFTKVESRQQVLNRMQAAQVEVLDRLWTARSANLPFTTKQDALALASIIEKETGIGGERRRISGVFVNRLKIGMPLQTDPTVIYALTMGKHQNDGKGPLGRRLLRKDLNIDSPYNTYRFKGLPPTPIANAGAAAIEAALHPESHNYLYFVADGTGGHVFSKTLDEHNNNAAKWRKIRKAQGN